LDERRSQADAQRSLGAVMARVLEREDLRRRGMEL
jgi:hypothetical protein